MRALAHIGITALVDEATGYQEVRDRLALQKILSNTLGMNGLNGRGGSRQNFTSNFFRLKGMPFPL